MYFKKADRCTRYDLHTPPNYGQTDQYCVLVVANQPVQTGELGQIVGVSCGDSTCFAVSACDGLCHLTKIMDRVETPLDYTQKSTRSTSALKPSVSPSFYPRVTATLLKVRLKDCHITQRYGDSLSVIPG